MKLEPVIFKSEIEKNIAFFENYFCEGSSVEQKYCYELIQRGSCFIAYKFDTELRFTPSRYIGYSNNSILSHELNEKDGKVTNVAISKVLGSMPLPNDELESEYLKYCQKFGISPYKKARKYWEFNFNSGNVQQSSSNPSEFPEGKLVERIHKAKERSSKLILEAKAKYRKTHQKLFCQICKFDFEKEYGNRGKDYIEAHHTVPVSSMTPDHKSKIDEIAMVCANCHRMLHRTRPWLGISELNSLLKK